MPRPESWYDARYWRLDAANDASRTNTWVDPENFQVLKHVAIGNNATITAGRVLQIKEIFNQDIDAVGVNVVVENTVPVTHPNWVYGLIFISQFNGVGTTGRNVGFFGQARLTGAGDMDVGKGGQFGVQNRGTGTMASGVGSHSTVEIISDGGITNAYGFRDLVSITGAGGISSSYGFYASNPTTTGGAVGTRYQFFAAAATTAGTNYGYYQEGTENNVFYGEIGLPGTSRINQTSTTANVFNGDLELPGTSRINQTSTTENLFGGNLIPMTDGKGFIGEGWRRWQYVGAWKLEAWNAIWSNKTIIGAVGEGLELYVDTDGGATVRSGPSPQNLKLLSTYYLYLGADQKIVMPIDDNLHDLGWSTYRWKDFYVGGNLSDGTNAVTVLQGKTGYDHSQLTHDYAYISTNDPSTDVTAVELEELSDGSHTALHAHARSDCVTYVAIAVETPNFLLVLRTWRDETVTTFVAQPDIPRNVTVSTAPQALFTMTGTVTVNGTDADGATISEVFTINDAMPTLHTGVRAFAVVTSVVTDQTDASTTSRYSVGIGHAYGLPNYPFNATTDVFKVNVGGAHYNGANYTVNATYGTITPTVAPLASTTMEAWYRPFK